MLIKLLKILGELLLVFLVLAAIALGLLRSLFPYIDRYRPVVEKLATETLHQPVKIGKLTASWKGIHPTLNLEEVSILDATGQTQRLHVQRLQVGIHVINSLFTWHLSPSSFSVSGMHLSIHRIDANTLEVNGIQVPVAAGASPLGDMQNMFGWLLGQGQIKLDNIDLDWEDQSGRIFQITQLEAELHNGWFGHQLIGLATLIAKTPARFRFVINVQEKGATRKSIQADIYLFIKNLDLQPWLKNYNWAGFGVTKGHLEQLQLWAKWQDNQWQQLQTVFDLKQAVVYSPHLNKASTIDELSSNLAWQQNANGFSLAADQIKLVLDKQQWPLTQVSMQQAQSTDIPVVELFRLDALDLQQLQNFALNMQLLPDTFKTLQWSLQARGRLAQIVVRRDVTTAEKASFSTSFNFNDLKTRAWKSMPALNGLSGHLQATPTAGDLQLAGSSLLVDFGKMFSQPWVFDHYNGHLQWIQREDGWKLQANNIAFSNATLATQANLDVLFPTNADTPYVQLLASFLVKNVQNVRHYLPTGMEHLRPLTSWLEGAFINGDSIDGQVLLQGPLAHFPFDDHSGRFELLAHTNNVELNYKTGWPPLTHLTSEVLWDDRRLQIHSEGAYISGLPTGSIQAEIPDLGHAELEIHSGIQADMSDGLNFIAKSPLQNTLGEALASLRLKGPMQLALQLHIPFYKGNKGGNLQGDVVVSPGGVLAIPTWGVHMTDLSGTFQFTQNSLTSNQLTAKWLAQPVNFSITTTPTATSKVIQVQMDSQASIATLKQQFGWDFLRDYIQGKTAYTATLQISENQGHPQTTFMVDSDLKGITLNLPEPAKKTADEKVATHFEMKSAGKTELNLFVQYAKKFSAALTLAQGPHKNWAFKSGDLRFGATAATFQNTSGLLIDGYLPRLVWSDIADFLTPLFKPQNTDTAAAAFPLRLVNLNFGQLTALGMTLSSVNLQAQPLQDAWRLQINSPTIAGSVTLPKDLSRTIQGNFDRFAIMSGVSQTVSGMNPGDIPPLDLTLHRFSYNNKPFGTIVLRTTASKNTLQIQQLTMTMPNATATATGRWQQVAKGRQQTTLSGNLNSQDLGAMLKAWMMTSSVMSGHGDLAFALSWPGPAYDFRMQQLNGNFSLAFRNGSIINVGDSSGAEMGIGRILNLLSLQSIPRRLSLDFSDLVQKGFAFDDMKGDFNIQNGNAITRNAYLHGPIAKVEVKGRIGLAAKDYGLTMMITPYLTSSLPVAATILGGPIAGAATWLGNKVLGGVVNKITMHTYVVSGPWDNPTIVKSQEQ